MYAPPQTAFEYELDNGSLSGLRFKHADNAHDTWAAALKASARSIASTATKPLWLGLSGGIGSETMCNAFFDQGISFSVFTIADSGGANRKEVTRASKWCEERGIYHNTFPLAYESFFTEGYRVFADKGYHANVVSRYFQLHLLEIVSSLNGSAVLGGGDMLYRFRAAANDPHAQLVFDASYLAPLEFVRRTNQHHIPLFFASTAEAIASYLSIPLIQGATGDALLFQSSRSVHLLRRLVYLHTFKKLRSRIEDRSVDRYNARDGGRVRVAEVPVSIVLHKSLHEIQSELGIAKRK